MRLQQLFRTEKTETEKEIEEFCERRKYERDVFDAALKQWAMESGLGEVILRQTEDLARQRGLDGWSDQFDHYRTVEFDERRPEHAEIKEHIDGET